MDRWQILETVDEAVVWREVLDDRRYWGSSPSEFPRSGPKHHLRGPHLRIRHQADGQAAVTELHSRLLGIGRSRMTLREMGLTYALNESGQQRLQAALAEEARLYAEAPERARRVSETNRERARAVFSAAFGLWQAGNFAAARRGFEEGLVINPWNGTAHFYLHDIFRHHVDVSEPGGAPQITRREAKTLLVGRHLRLAAVLLPPDSREGIEARTMLSAT
jgi:hypothetical protein